MITDICCSLKHQQHLPTFLIKQSRRILHQDPTQICYLHNQRILWIRLVSSFNLCERSDVQPSLNSSKSYITKHFVLSIQNGIQFPTTNAPDVDDAGVEEIAINSSGVLQHSNITDHDKIPSIGSDKSDISKLNFTRQNESADVEATLNNGTLTNSIMKTVCNNII